MIFEIWSEGYRATGESGTAHLHGKEEATSFEEALLLHALRNEEFYKYLDHKPSSKGSNYTYWACRLFDNEKDARKSFG